MKRYKALLPFLLSLSISTTSCASANLSTTIGQIHIIKEILANEKNGDSLTQDYYDYFNNLEFTYNYQEKYITREEITSLIEENKQITACSYEFDGDISAIADEIKENSSNNDFFTRDNIIILNRILKKIYINSKSNKDEDFHKLLTIKIAYGNGDDLGTVEGSDIHYTAYFDEDTNTLYLDKRYIQMIASQEVVSFNYYLEYVLEHELNHVRQVLCDCNDDITNTKVAYGEHISFLLESTAESSLYNELNQNYKINYNYPDERIKESEILLLGLFNNESIDNYYASIYDVDLEGLHNYLDLSEEEIYDFYNIIYAIDGSLCRNNLPYEIFPNIKGVTYGELKKEIGFAYKQNLFKMIIMRLLKYNNENDISLEDNLAIYYLIKNLIFYDCYYYEETDDSIKKIYPEEVKAMLEMDDKYIEYLSRKYHKSIEKIREIESIEGYLGSYSLITYISSGEVPYDTYQKQVNRLLTYFPTLPNIINNYTDEIYLGSYSAVAKTR